MFRFLAISASVAVLGLTAAACGDDDESQTQTAAAPDPVAQVEGLSGRATEVTLDAGLRRGARHARAHAGARRRGRDHEGRHRPLPDHGRRTSRTTSPAPCPRSCRAALDHDGSGLSLTGGGKTVELTDFVVDPGASVLTGTVTVDGEVAAQDAPLFFLDGRTLEPLRTGEGTAVLEGTTVKLKDEAATLLNDTFGTDALAGGLVIGVAKITIATQA